MYRDENSHLVPPPPPPPSPELLYPYTSGSPNKEKHNYPSVIFEHIPSEVVKISYLGEEHKVRCASRDIPTIFANSSMQFVFYLRHYTDSKTTSRKIKFLH